MYENTTENKFGTIFDVNIRFEYIL